eukprot:CAMPEP_0119516092 /NCGR_PEP_ID=MMETSP1344-20130328/33382_1 /TAXON_ID=236787 /ORGANISM="Florenciella parvula, Strain CCMP2471" /LENGTH=208 /DNA_ID=CAMNT_0007553555 /DNA_START=17 /DNA_END=640 /DNA_ORIENTATION=-
MERRGSTPWDGLVAEQEDDLSTAASDADEDAPAMNDRTEQYTRREERLHEAEKIEAEDPMTLAHLLRGMLFAYGQRLVFLPDASRAKSMVHLPYMQGADAEVVITSIFRKYARPDGVIDMAGWRDFVTDSDIVRTHVVHDSHGRPDVRVATQLDASMLFQQFSQPSPHSNNPEDAIMEFPFFYRTLLMMSKIAYPERYEQSMTDTFNA